MLYAVPYIVLTAPFTLLVGIVTALILQGLLSPRLRLRAEPAP
ncbi:MAG: hypothetical protein ACREK5_00065 [Gemmatimonadota bacterium]